MRLSSREYQHRVAPNLFAKGDVDVARFLAFVARLDPRVRLTTDSIRSSEFTRELLDTAGRAFGARGLKLRIRKYRDRLTCTFKAIALDRYVVRRARIMPAPAFRSKAVVKFEEGIYALHSAFSKQSTIPLPLGWQFARVSDWGRIFPGALEVSPRDEPLAVIAQRVIRRTHKMILEFVDIEAEAMLELGFLPGSEAPETADFSWKYRRKKGPFSPEAVVLMRQFSQALNQSEWADLDVHVRKALADAGASWSSQFAEIFSKAPAGAHAPLSESQIEDEENDLDDEDDQEEGSEPLPSDASVATGDGSVPTAPITEPGGFSDSEEPSEPDAETAAASPMKAGRTAK
jgi:hypothetical protein